MTNSHIVLLEIPGESIEELERVLASLVKLVTAEEDVYKEINKANESIFNAVQILKSARQNTPLPLQPKCNFKLGSFDLMNSLKRELAEVLNCSFWINPLHQIEDQNVEFDVEISSNRPWLPGSNLCKVVAFYPNRNEVLAKITSMTGDEAISYMSFAAKIQTGQQYVLLRYHA